MWFFALFFLFPWSLPFYTGPFVPAVRYWILGSAGAAVAATEGAAGAAGPIVGLLLGWALVTTALCWLIASLVARAAGRLPDRSALLLSYCAITFGLAWALLFQPYTTTFGRALRGGLLQVLS